MIDDVEETGKIWIRIAKDVEENGKNSKKSLFRQADSYKTNSTLQTMRAIQILDTTYLNV